MERKQLFLSCFPTHTALSRAIGICIFEEFAYSNCIGRTADLDSLNSITTLHSKGPEICSIPQHCQRNPPEHLARKTDGRRDERVATVGYLLEIVEIFLKKEG